MSSLMPRFRMVSIIPGMEMRAPDRTDTSSGLVVEPNWWPMAFSSSAIRSRMVPASPSGSV